MLELGGPTSVVDEQSVPIEVTWRTGNGDPVAGQVAVYRRVGDSWRLDRRVRTGADGIVRFSVAPRTDTRWQARAGRLAWVEGARSDTHAIDNRPPGTPVALPAGAPRPEAEPAGAGPRRAAPAPNVVDHRRPRRRLERDDRAHLAPRLPRRARPRCGWCG